MTGGSFFSRGSKVRYSGRVERELAEDVILSVAAVAAAVGGGDQAGPGARGRSQREAYASRRSTSEPIRDFDDEDEDDEADDLSFDHPRPSRHRSIERNARRRDDLSVPSRHRHHDDGSFFDQICNSNEWLRPKEDFLLTFSSPSFSLYSC